VEQIPVSTVSLEKQKTLERLVDRIIAAKQRDAGADVSGLEWKIDQMV
jgi:hypothetical protein